MNITVSGDNLEVGDTLNRYTKDKISLVFAKYSFNPVHCNITFSKNQNEFDCYISSYIDASVGFQSKHSDRDVYTSLRVCMYRFEKQLRRFKRKLKVHSF